MIPGIETLYTMLVAFWFGVATMRLIDNPHSFYIYPFGICFGLICFTLKYIFAMMLEFEVKKDRLKNTKRINRRKREERMKQFIIENISIQLKKDEK